MPIGAWVLGTALRQLADWRSHGSEIGVSVNVSARQLTDESVGLMVAALLAETGVPASALCLEVTETAVLSDPIRVADRLAELRTLGVRIAFDDFGTGYSSLRHLSQLPVDVIKLDRTFVTGLNRPEGRRDRAILIAVTTAARELGISVVAEGVEAGRIAPDGTSAVVLRSGDEDARAADPDRGRDAVRDAREHRLRSNA